MGFCGGIVKTFLFVLNFVLFLGGLLILAAGGYMHYQISSEYGAFFEEGASKAGLFGIGVGVVVTLVSFLGCCGLMKSSSCMLKAYGVMVAVLLIAEIGTGIAATLYKGQAEDILVRGMNSALDKYSETDETRLYIKETWDAAQEGLKCCGVEGYNDWTKSSGWANTQDVPDSCCKTESKGCGKGAIASPASINQVGCKDTLKDIIKSNIAYVVYVGLGLGFFQIILIIAACVIGKKMGYQEEFMQTV